MIKSEKMKKASGQIDRERDLRCQMVAFALPPAAPAATSCHLQVRVKASNEVGWSIEPVQISCRTAERPHRPRHLSCVDLGALHEESRRSCQRTNLHKTWQQLTKLHESIPVNCRRGILFGGAQGQGPLRTRTNYFDYMICFTYLIL